MAVPTIELNDGTHIPQLGFGTWQVADNDAVSAVATALQTGYRHIDTAAAYGNEAGVGRAIRESGIAREDLWVTTKLWNDRHGDARAALEESLEKLGLDRVDLYLIHWPVAGSTQRPDAWRAMIQAQEDGLVRSIGVSNFLADNIREITDLSQVTPSVNQIEVHPTFGNEALVRFDQDMGIATQAWSPLGQGKDLENPTVEQIAQRLGKTPGQVVIRWHLQEGRIVIPKSTTPARIAENFEVFDFELTPDDLAAIDGLSTDERMGPDPAAFGQ
ncbi:aldo/keto reductase [Brevibacterium sp. 5221]|uniref:Aldo/keto reductase n=1 Tax=Brevibacterium rongguiense TaxID=2695267 RepID=A0A6N9H9W2_9MICO|nr:aldo/keto reductase [Brevibacterium rongguiense]MYM20292.1 aldo/keto reductase [Brevibacterium rongguiense]